MLRTRNLTLLCTLLAASGCHPTYVVPETPMPPNTILLSQMMRQLSARPGFTQGLLTVLDGQSKKAPLPMTPALVDELRKRVLGNDWQGLDRFPGWPMREINPTLEVVTKIVQHKETTSAQTAEFLDLGTYALDKAQTVSLDQPSTLPGFSTEGAMVPLGAGVVHGDGPSALASEHAESQWLADLLNRIAMNHQPGVGLLSLPMMIRLGNGHLGCCVPDPESTPEEVVAKLQVTGHTVTVDDARYFANFAHLHYTPPGASAPEDVMAPFWIDSQLVIPHSHGRHLLVPAVHAEYEWHIRAPQGKPGINADVSYYYGDDGKSEWRTMDLQDQPWVLERNAHTYTGAQAVEVTRLAGLLTVAYMHQHADHPELPFGGYYTLGVCQDGIAAIEQKMTGASTLFPNTADMAYFNDPRDAEANALLAAIPKDRDGTPPEPARVFGSLPVAPDNFRAVTIPGLADDLNATYAASQHSTPHRSSWRWVQLGAALLALFAAITFFLRARKRTTTPTG